ncbi:MAG TPA: dihydropteroate synthase [Burkholderiales bacterium]|jgi:dihydropteroate synthase|nr:dihydropteroate synthase [Burkholderiales bacterium]
MLRCGPFQLSLARPLIMGIVNVTPDSFSDGGRFCDPARAIEHARRLVEEGADILDIGGESSRPGAATVSIDQELTRVLPVLEGLRGIGVPISVDTVKPEVMRAAIGAGAAVINDISALSAPGALEAIATSDVAVCLMHMQGEPRSMQTDPSYGDVVAEVQDYLLGRMNTVLAAGIAKERLILDPGFGFGKNLQHNLALLRALPQFTRLGPPLLIGWSRKSSLGTITGRPAQERMPASLAAALLCAQRGAKILRVHDVAATRDVVAVWEAVEAPTDRSPQENRQ